jgi:hypothetical protein
MVATLPDWIADGRNPLMIHSRATRADFEPTPTAAVPGQSPSPAAGAFPWMARAAGAGVSSCALARGLRFQMVVFGTAIVMDFLVGTHDRFSSSFSRRLRDGSAVN